MRLTARHNSWLIKYFVLIFIWFAITPVAIAEPSSNPDMVAELVSASQTVSAEITKPKPLPPLGKAILCNCYAYVKYKLGNIPRSQILIRDAGDTGNIAVFYYAESGLHHYAVVVGDTPGGYMIEETNYRSCTKTTREIPYNDRSLIGFYPHYE